MLKAYISQIKQGHYEASIPWIAELADPIRGASPSQLKEDLMFRALELVMGGVSPQVLDRVLIPPDNLQVFSVYVDVDRIIEPHKPPVSLSVVTQVVLGSWENDPLLRIWLPRIPQVCIPVLRVEDIYVALSEWVTTWADDLQLDDLSQLEAPAWGRVEDIEVELGTPPALLSAEESPLGKGRMRRPEALMQAASNLTHRAADDALSPAFGRELLVEQLVALLTSPQHVNICLIGPPGVGKTSIIHEAVRRAFKIQRIYQARRDFWETSGDRIIAGMSVIGQWEQRVATMIDELSERDDVLIVQDLLAMVRAGRTFQGDSNVARFLEPALEQDRFALIVEATEETYALARSLAPGFVEQLRPLRVPELAWRETLGVLTQLVRNIEYEHSALRFSPDGIETILSLTRRFYKQEAFPGKAVQLARQCEMAALRQIHQRDEPRPEPLLLDTPFIAQVFHNQTGLPRAILEPGTGRPPQHVRDALQARLYGQPEALDIIASLIVTVEQGLTDPNRPMAALLLVGPSGVGKTETAKALAEQLFGHEDRMIRFDMSEFNTPLAVSRLIGTPAQPDGELTGRVRLQPFCVILLDEIEKAHSDVLDLFLQVLGDGRLTDAAGRAVDLRNAIVIMTSNLGARAEDHWLGFQGRGEVDRALHYRRQAQAFFRPELFNRLDHVVPYRSLGPEALRRIASRTLLNLLERRGLRQAQIMVDVDEALIEHLIRDAVDPRYGARTLARRIERTLIAPLARRLTTHIVTDGLTRVTVRADPQGAISLDLHVLRRAPLTQTEPGIQLDAPTALPKPRWLTREGRAPLTALQLVEALQDLACRVEALEARPQIPAITREYDALLARFNDPAQQDTMLKGGAPAEELRQREVVLRRLQHVRARLDGMLDPRRRGEYVFPMAQEIDRRKQRLWSAAVIELDHELIWLEVQLQSLTSRLSDGATLLLTGLSGPYSSQLDLWLTLLRALDEVFELELSFCERLEGTWRPLRADTSPRRGTRVAIAVSGEAPGILAIFNTLDGYAWSPKQPSHGQHALTLAQTLDRAVIGARALADALQSGELSAPADPPERHIEFIEQRGQLEDVRLARALPIPQDRAENMNMLATRLVMERIAWRGDVYQRQARSGVWRALTSADLRRHDQGGES